MGLGYYTKTGFQQEHGPTLYRWSLEMGIISNMYTYIYSIFLYISALFLGSLPTRSHMSSNSTGPFNALLKVLPD